MNMLGVLKVTFGVSPIFNGVESAWGRGRGASYFVNAACQMVEGCQGSSMMGAD